YFAGVPQRMAELVPEVKLIYLVRDPIERIISHYTHNYSEGREHRSIDEALQELEGNHYVMCSRYFWQLPQYLQFFLKIRCWSSPLCSRWKNGGKPCKKSLKLLEWILQITPPNRSSRSIRAARNVEKDA